MRHMMPLVFVLVACTAPAPVEGPRGPQGPPGESSTLEVMELRAMVVELEKRIEARKVPHLVVTATGEDLGPFVGWDYMWSDALGGLVSLRSAKLLIYGSGDCSGAAMINGVSSQEVYVIDTRDRIVAVTGAPIKITVNSYFDDGACVAYPVASIMDGAAFVETGSAMHPITRDALTIRPL